MAKSEWLEVLGWGKEELSDLRLVAYSYVKEGIYDIALTFFDALAILSQENPYDLQMAGALYLQVGNSLKALDLLDRALKLDPTHLPSRLNRAKALFALGGNYRKRAMEEAAALSQSESEEVASQAKALLLSHR